MGSISIFSNGKEFYQRSIGYSDIEKNLEANATTKYRIGSITKTFTAVVIMQLIVQKTVIVYHPGRIKLNHLGRSKVNHCSRMKMSH